MGRFINPARHRFLVVVMAAIVAFSFFSCHKKKEEDDTLFLLALLYTFFSSSAPCPATGGQKQVTVSWSASRSFDADSVAGGGHRIYYSGSPGVSKNTPNVIDVPNTVSKTSGTITGLRAGCYYYVKVGAYSALNPAGGELSVQKRIYVP